MPKEIQQILDGIAHFFDNPVVQLGLKAIAVYFVILWLAGAYWAFRDMQLRSENPILPYLAASFVIVFTPFFFPFAIFLYRVVRPQEKLGEVYERNLAEEALLAEVEAIHGCAGCGRRVNEDWIICPTCRTRLNRVCPNCSRLVGLDWSLCAWCGKDFERPEVLPGVVEPRDIEATDTVSAAVVAPIRARGRAGQSGTPAARAASGGAPTGPLPER